MKVLLVRPARPPKAITVGEFMFAEPLGLEAVATVWGVDHQVELLDLMVEGVDPVAWCRAHRPGVVGLTSLCIDVGSVLDLARELKEVQPWIVTVVGGTQASVIPHAFFDPAVDHVFQHTTTANLRQLMEHLAAGTEVPLIDGVRSRVHDFRSTGVKGRNEAIPPDRTATVRYREHYSYFGFRPCALLQTSRGCSQHCRFCLRWRIEGPREEPFPMDQVFEEIVGIDEPSIMIIDNDFLNDGARLTALCERLELAHLRRDFICYGSVRGIIENRDQVRRFARNGLRAVVVGYESFSDEELGEYAKRTTRQANLEAAKILRDSGIAAWASFILHPDWDEEDFARLRAHVRELAPEVTSLVPLTPFPGTTLAVDYADRLLVDPVDYEKWSFGELTVRPGKLSVRQYYTEIMRTNLYVNLFSNNTRYLVKQFGAASLARSFAGSVKLLGRYVGLMAAGDTSKRRSG